MDVSKTIEEFSRFFNEILGYFLPGFIFNLMIYLTIDNKFIPILEDKYLLNPWVVILLSYVMGYGVYGIALFRDLIFENFYSIKIITKIVVYVKKRLNKKSDNEKLIPRILPEQISYDISNLGEYKATVNILCEKTNHKIQEWKFKSIRSLVMSYIPEADQKIYTFMFRSELGNHIGFVFLLFGLWLILAKVAYALFGSTLLIKSSLLDYYYMSILIIVISYFFHLTRKRFLSTTFKIPFSIFLSKYKPINYV